jgi:hypothetical protein
LIKDEAFSQDVRLNAWDDGLIGPCCDQVAEAFGIEHGQVRQKLADISAL